MPSSANMPDTIQKQLRSLKEQYSLESNVVTGECVVMLLRWKWYTYQTAEALAAYKAHRRFCPTCRARMTADNALAQRRYTHAQEQAWEAEGA